MFTLDSIHDNWAALSKKLNGNFTFSEYERAYVKAGIVTARIRYLYKERSIEINQAIYESNRGRLDFRYLEISTKLITEDFSLNLWRSDLFDRLFKNKRITTGFADFDQFITVKCSDENIAFSVFQNPEIRKAIQDNKDVVLNTVKENDNHIFRLRSYTSPNAINKIETLADLVNKISSYIPS